MNSVGAYKAGVTLSSGNAVGAYDAPVESGEFLRRRREQHIRRQIARRLGMRELWAGRQYRR